MAETFDAVLIGAGHNALACALHLAAKGWRVGVFEQAAVAGGAVKTGEYTLPGFRHDWAAMNLSLFAGSPFFKAYGAELTAHGLEFAPVDAALCQCLSRWQHGWASAPIWPTPRRGSRRCRRADAATWERCAPSFRREAEHLFGLLGSPMKIRALASFVFKMLRGKGLAGTLDLARFLMLSPRAVADADLRSRRKLQRDAGRLGHASGFRARHRGRRAVSLSGGDGQPGLRHGAGQGRGRHDHPRAGRGDRGARRRGRNAALRWRGSCTTAAARPGSTWPMAGRSPRRRR